MIKFENITSFNSMDDLDNIEFKVAKDLFSRFPTYCCQNIITFDIETSNLFVDPHTHIAEGFNFDKAIADPEYYKRLEPVSVMYIWQCAIEDWKDHSIKVFHGRSWDSFYEFMHRLSLLIRVWQVFTLDIIHSTPIGQLLNEVEFNYKRSKNTVAYMYIHNLGFEFNHLRNLFNDDFAKRTGKGRVATFGRKPRKPMKTIVRLNGLNFEMRDSAVLTQKSLAQWGEDEDLPVKKLEEPKDYYLHIRTPLTALKQEDFQYSINDVVTMVYGLDKYRERYQTMQNIPLTQTGQVRRVCIKEIALANQVWSSTCTDITLSYTPEFFSRLIDAFAGGWTHGNSLYTGKKFYGKDRASGIAAKHFDFASSYPNVMTNRKYCIKAFEECDVSEFDTLSSVDFNTNNYDYHFIVHLKLTNVSSLTNNTFWSSSKCVANTLTDAILDNGKIYECSSCEVVMTGIDWQVFKTVYKCDYEVLELWKSEAGYLPYEEIETILKYYAYKTTLKEGPAGETEEKKAIRLSKYNESKQFVNSIYGVNVYKMFSDQIEFDEDGWHILPLTPEKFYEIAQESVKGDKIFQQFTIFQVGLFVTAWAKFNLWSIIEKLDEDVLYGDTDSLFIRDGFDTSVIDNYNTHNAELQEECVAWHQAHGYNLTIDDYCPKTLSGKVKRLGIFAEEPDAIDFCYLGAKRYCQRFIEKGKEKVECTVAGLPKSAGANKVKSIDEFNNDTVWNCRESQKQTAIYNDKQSEFDVTDEDGVTYHCDDKYGVCIMPIPFDMSMSGEYQSFVRWIQSDCERDYECEEYSDTPDMFLTGNI